MEREPATILLVEDDPTTCATLRGVLERRGHRVITAADGVTGVHEALARLPDLVLLDKELPGMHGFEVCRTLRLYPATSTIPILMISADDQLEQRVCGLDLGADDFVPKSVSTRELESRVRAFLRIKHLQDRLRGERDKLAALFRHLREPVAICDDRGRIVLASRAFLDLVRLPREIARLRTLDEILQVLEVDATARDRLLAATGEPVLLEGRLDGAEMILTARAAVVPLEDATSATAVILQDVTARVAHERMKADFHSMIAHDLRSPLAVIQGYVGLLATAKAGPLTSTQAEFLAAVDEKVLELTQLLDDFLDISKIDAGFVNLRREDVGLAEVVREVVGDLAALARDRGLVVESQLEPESLRLSCDPLRLKQILLNLASNAIKYNVDDGWVRLAATVDGEAVVLTVADGGQGITAEEREELFRPYCRGKSGRRIKGVGLGLAIVKKLVEAHGGTVAVASEPGQGATFTVRLPRTPLADPSPPLDDGLAAAVR